MDEYGLTVHCSAHCSLQPRSPPHLFARLLKQELNAPISYSFKPQRAHSSLPRSWNKAFKGACVHAGFHAVSTSQNASSDADEITPADLSLDGTPANVASHRIDHNNSNGNNNNSNNNNINGNGRRRKLVRRRRKTKSASNSGEIGSGNAGKKKRAPSEDTRGNTGTKGAAEAETRFEILEESSSDDDGDDDDDDDTDDGGIREIRFTSYTVSL